jgi:hypothetical protein
MILQTATDAATLNPPRFTHTPPMPRTWAEFAAIEPRLSDLEAWARRMPKRRGCQHWQQYETLKSHAARLVGWYAKDARLGSSHCYEVVIDRLLFVLETKGAKR